MTVNAFSLAGVPGRGRSARHPVSPVTTLQRALFLGLLLTLVLVLGACSSVRPGKSAGASGSSGGASAGGGYYLDDGPGGKAPIDPMSVPDAVPRKEPLNPRTMRPYTALGQRFEPMTELVPYRAQGVASWYGRRYHGRKTSSGEVYDMYAMTGAHPTLPIPSYVRVRHLGNGRQVVVRINDRGPFLNNRLIDLSYTAATRLGYLQAGHAKVEVELITEFDDPGPQPTMATPVTMPPAPDSPVVAMTRVEVINPAGADSAVTSGLAGVGTQSAAPVGQRLYLQLGAYASRETADAAASRIAQRIGSSPGELLVRQEGALHKIHAGPYADQEQAQAAALRLEQLLGFRAFAVSR